MRNPTVSIPEELDDAIRAEAYRSGRHRHEVLVDFLRESWPAYIERKLRRDLGHPIETRIVEAKAELCADDIANRERTA